MRTRAQNNDATEIEEDESADIESPYGRLAAPENPSQVYSVRIPTQRLEELRLVAARQRVAPSALMRKWVLERLDKERTHPRLQCEMRVSGMSAKALADWSLLGASPQRNADVRLLVGDRG